MSRTIIFFGIVSLLADIAGEMLFPILPKYLTSEIGISVVILGIIEGVADGWSDLVQVWFGWVSDRLRKRKIFVLLGYSVAATGKFLLALAYTWPMVFVARLFDRGGKGIRTSPRDAMIAGAIEKDRRGVAFGFHRTMDSSGAILGNALAVVLVGIGLSFRSIVWLSLIPAGLAILFVLPVREVREENGVAGFSGAAHKKAVMPTWKDFTSDRKKFGREFWRFIFVSAVFHLGKITYAFLLLRASGLGVPDSALPLLYLVFNIIQTAFSLPAGKMADGFGKAILVMIGFVLFAAMSIGFLFVRDLGTLIVLFAVYGLSFAFLEVGVRAFSVELSPHGLKGTGLGIFFTVSGLCTIVAGSVGGILWERYGARGTFVYSAALTGIAAVMFFVFFWRRIRGAFVRLES